MYKSKYCKEPALSNMKKAIKEMRHEGRSSSVVCKEFEIPARTMRRYIRISKDPKNKLFYLEEKQEEAAVRSWKPTSSVPMFTLDDFQKYHQNMPPKPLSTLNIHQGVSATNNEEPQFSFIIPHFTNLDSLWQDLDDI